MRKVEPPLRTASVFAFPDVFGGGLVCGHDRNPVRVPSSEAELGWCPAGDAGSAPSGCTSPLQKQRHRFFVPTPLDEHARPKPGESVC